VSAPAIEEAPAERASSTERSAFWTRRAPLLLVAAAVLFGLVTLWPERTDVWYLNDASVHRSMVRWAADRIRDGHLPFDGWYPYLSLGASRFHHYQSLPHIVTGALSIPLGEATFRWSLYLLLATWPVAVYLGARLLGLGRWPAAAAALVSPLVASEPGLGYEWGSYVWRGSGTWAQLWGMWALPFAWGLSWRAISSGRRLWLAALVLGVTVCVHLLTGYLALCCLVVFVVAKPPEVLRRLGRAAIVGIGALAVAAWMLVPLVTDAGWTVNDEFSRGTFYYDSFGARRILEWAVRGQLFDAGRMVPVLTILLAIGLVFAVVQARRSEPPRVVIGLGLVSLILFFGRPTLGAALHLLPGGGDLFLRRFISGVHLAGLYLAGIGATFCIGRALAFARARGWSVRPIAIGAGVAAVALLASPVVERVAFERQGAVWIDQQVAAQAGDGLGFSALVQRAQTVGGGRIFAGLRRSGVARYRIGSVPGFAALLNLQADGVGFTRPTWSLMSPSEYRFRIDNPAHPELFGVRYVIQPEGTSVPDGRHVAQVGRHVLWEIPDARYAELVDTVAPVAVDRTNIGEQMSSILSSGLPGHGYLPTVRFGGRAAAPPTLSPKDLPASRPGTVTRVDASPQDGSFDASVHADRDAVVVFAASYDPRWDAWVDGEPVPTQMISPALVGVPVPVGDHNVSIRYHAYPRYVWLFALGVAWLLGAFLVERLRSGGEGTMPLPDMS
jgi:hypothetical protein